MLISHDWHLLELTADRLWLVADGRVTPYNGDLEDYRKSMLAARKAAPIRHAEPWAAEPKATIPRPAKRKALEPLRRSAREAETAMQSLLAEKQRIERLLAEPDLPGVKRVQMMRSHGELAERVEAAEAAWLAAQEALEAAA